MALTSPVSDHPLPFCSPGHEMGTLPQHTPPLPPFSFSAQPATTYTHKQDAHTYRHAHRTLAHREVTRPALSALARAFPSYIYVCLYT